MKTFQFESVENNTLINIFAESEETANIILNEQVINVNEYTSLGELIPDLDLDRG